jgi:sulfite exporter TauE/SafE
MASELYIALLTGMGLGLASAPHCAFMCGPIATHAGVSGQTPRYLAGRFVGYGLLGSLSGALGRTLLELAPVRAMETLLSLALAIALGVAAYRLSRRPKADTEGPLLSLGRTKRPTSLVSRWLAAVAHDPVRLGVGTALLPCGALYAAVLAAAAQGTALAGALSMLSFAAVSGLALFGVGKLASRVVLRERGKRALAVVLAVGACVLVWRPLSSLGRAEQAPACHGAPHAEAER